METTIGQAKTIVNKIFTKGDTRTNLFLHSSPGLGKSSIIHQLAADHSLPVVDLRLATMEATDLCGIPYVYEGDQLFSTPTWFPTDPDSRGILFFDELSNAPTNVQHAAYRIILDREIQHGKRLPDGWFIVAAGNQKTDRTGVKGIVPALANRFSVHLVVEPNLDDFIHYAIANGFSKEVVGFLNFQPDALYRFDPTKGDMAFPTPRSWEYANRLLTVGYNDDEVLAVLSGCVGEGTANQFLSFRKYYSKLPNFADIMAGKSTYKVPTEDLGLIFAVCSSLTFLMMENHENASKLGNLNNILDQLPDEALIMIFKIIAGTKESRMILNVVKSAQSSYQRVKSHIKV